MNATIMKMVADSDRNSVFNKAEYIILWGVREETRANI